MACLSKILSKKLKKSLNKQLQDEKESKIVMEASMAALQLDLRDALAKIEEFERQERKRIELKKKNIKKKRQQMVISLCQI